MSRLARPRASLLFVLGHVAIWEGVKLLGGDPLGEWRPPFDWTIARDLNMPHAWDIATAFVEPAQRNSPRTSTRAAWPGGRLGDRHARRRRS